MARSPVAVFDSNYRNIEGLAELQRRVAALPDAIVSEVKPALERSGDMLVNRIRPLVPVGDDLEQTPGALRDSLHREPGDHELAVLIVEDAKDDKGRAIGKHVEHGHKAADGSHVAAKPHFWIGYQLTKKAIRARLNRAINAGIKKGWNK
jgi:hypothetical protein